MAPLPALIMEYGFNVIYLIAVWILVAMMVRNRNAIRPQERGSAGYFLLAFVLLATGDSFHVGGRTYALFAGAEGSMVQIAGTSSSVIGLGMLATAYTMTIFYMLLAGARSAGPGGRKDGWFWTMQILLGLRLVIMVLPGNGWDLPTSPANMSILRNIPLLLAGFPMAILYILDGRRSGDRAWAGIGWTMLASYLFYTPVIFLSPIMPKIGLLMIPKTIAYVIMGLIAYRRFWSPKAASQTASLATARR